jgi:hypothetical protein
MNGAVAYDEAREVVVLVTPGPIRSAQVMETWTWDGRVWTRQAPATSPSVRSSALLAYDESRRVTVFLDSMGRSDIWEWDGANWSQRTPAHSPDAVQQPGSMAYDPTTYRMLLWQRQTWSWDGNDWTQLQPAHIPGLWEAKLVFDGKRLILNGGSLDGNRMETWGWNGIDWSLVAAGHAPDFPFLPAAFDAASGKVVVYGGGPGDDTWTWDGMKWGREHPAHSPAARPRHLLYDKALSRVVGFAATDQGTITGIYGWDGSDWSALEAGSPPAVAAGNGLVSASDAEAMVRRTVTNTHPVLLPQLPGGVTQALVSAYPDGFSLRVMNDDRSILVTMGIVVPGNSNLGAASKRIAFRGASAYYQYIADDPTGWRDLWWTERPGHLNGDPGLKGPDGVPYVLRATGLTEAEFFVLAGSLR